MLGAATQKFALVSVRGGSSVEFVPYCGKMQFSVQSENTAVAITKVVPFELIPYYQKGKVLTTFKPTFLPDGSVWGGCRRSS